MSQSHSAKLLLITNPQKLEGIFVVLMMSSEIYTDEGRASEIVNM